MQLEEPSLNGAHLSLQSFEVYRVPMLDFFQILTMICQIACPYPRERSRLSIVVAPAAAFLSYRPVDRGS